MTRQLQLKKSGEPFEASIIAEHPLHSPTPFVITFLGIFSGLAGIFLGSLRGYSQRLVPFGGGVLAGVAVFWLVPEIANVLGWMAALGCVAVGVAALALVNRFVYPVCPSCSGPHDHDHCAQSLHGFAAPLVLAASLHAILDGWSLGASGENVIHLGSLFGWAIGIHKIPEGIALGVMLRAALPRWGSAAVALAVAQLCTLLGTGLEWMTAGEMSPQWMQVVLALAAGSFIFLGGHAIHGEWRRRGMMPAFVPALAGLASPSMLRLFRLI